MPGAEPVGLLLAAGRGSRFDASGQRNKLLAPLADGRPLAVVAAQHLLGVLPRVVAVVAPDATLLAKHLADVGCEVVLAPAATPGMGASLACGVAASREASGWVVALADMPCIAASTIASVRDGLLAGHDLVAPRYAGQRGHPVGISARHLNTLLTLSGDQGARRLFATEPVHWVDVEDEGVLRDVDTPDDLNHLPLRAT